MRILAVDDDPIFLELLTRMLFNYGETDVVVAGSGAEALGAIKSAANRFDLFLFDILMPEMDGIELVRKVRGMPGNESTPIMMITTATQRDYVDKAFRVGASDYLTKPFDALEFHARIGMMKRLNAENSKRRELLAVIGKSQTPAPTVPFEEPMTVSSVDGMLDYSVLCGYISALGRIERLGVSVMAVSVENMASIYARSTQKTLTGAVGTIATVLRDSMRPRLAMISYVGNGDFVCVIKYRTQFDQDELLTSINLEQSGLRDEFISKRLPMPVYRLGHQISMGIFTNRDIAHVVASAIASARRGGSEQPAKLRMSA